MFRTASREFGRAVIAFVSVAASQFALEQVATPLAVRDVGANLEGIADWSRTVPFNDLMKQARAFGSPEKPWEGQVRVDQDGWPTEDFGVILGSWPGMRGVGGTYRISFDCEVQPSIVLVASPGSLTTPKRISPIRWLMTLEYPEGGAQLMLAFRGVGRGLRNLSVLRPDAGTGMFRPAFLEHLRRFSGVRFMDWTKTNGNPVARWDQRTPVGAPSYAVAPGGVPWEVCIELCNQLGKDAWINVPHRADPQYIRHLAQMFKLRLDPRLKVTVEYSNEVWNWGFQQATWNLEAAKRAVAAGNSVLNSDGEANEGVWAARRIALRTHEIGQIFRAEFGMQAYSARVRLVLCTQVGWPANWLVNGLRFWETQFGPPAKTLDAIGVAPYFNLGALNDRQDMTAESVLAALGASVVSQRNDINLEACAALARWHGLRLLGYEGGPDTFGPNGVAAKHEASIDPRFEPICREYLENWSALGGDRMMWFVAGATNYDGPYGTWGVTDDMERQDSPKIRAIDGFLAGLSEPGRMARSAMSGAWAGRTVPCAIDARQFVLRDTNWLSDPNATMLSAKDWKGTYRDYLAFSPNSGLVWLNLETRGAPATVQVWLNGSLYGKLDSGGGEAWQTGAAVRVPMRAGSNVVRIMLESGQAVQIKTIRLSRERFLPETRNGLSLMEWLLAG